MPSGKIIELENKTSIFLKEFHVFCNIFFHQVYINLSKAEKHCLKMVNRISFFCLNYFVVCSKIQKYTAEFHKILPKIIHAQLMYFLIIICTSIYKCPLCLQQWKAIGILDFKLRHTKASKKVHENYHKKSLLKIQSPTNVAMFDYFDFHLTKKVVC